MSVGFSQCSASIANGYLTGLVNSLIIVDSLIIVEYFIWSCLKVVSEASLTRVSVDTPTTIYAGDRTIFW